MFYQIKMLQSDDATYTASDLSLWMTAEMTAGFLIIGFPSLPKVAKSVPFMDSMASLVRSMVDRSGLLAKRQSDSQRGLPSWVKPAPQRRPNPMEVSTLGTMDSDQEPVFFATTVMEGGGEKKEKIGVTREVEVRVENV